MYYLQLDLIDIAQPTLFNGGGQAFQKVPSIV